MSIHAYAAQSPGALLAAHTEPMKSLEPYSIDVQITHCGICHSDIHLIDNDWGNSVYPLVPGHEIIGIVKRKGDRVKEIEVGDRVGIGWQRSSCMRCEWCNKGEENLCAKQEATCVGHPGGYADRIIADGRFAFKIPEAIESEFAGPLLCGGATVFSPFVQHGLTALDRVGVVGIGGLGHMALQFASALGCRVTAYSTSKDKAAEAAFLGASDFVDLNDPEEMQKRAGSLDFILSTAPSDVDWSALVNLLRPKGMLCTVGSVSSTLKIPVIQLLSSRKRISASNIASRPVIREMLRLSAEKGIRPKVEIFPLKEVNQAIEKLRRNQVKYRAVLKMPPPPAN